MDTVRIDCNVLIWLSILMYMYEYVMDTVHMDESQQVFGCYILVAMQWANEDVSNCGSDIL